MNASLPQPDPSTHVAPGEPNRPRSSGLARPKRGRRIGGVCAAIADKYGWSRTTVRLLTLVSVVLPGPQVLAYLIGWIVIPSEDDAA